MCIICESFYHYADYNILISFFIFKWLYVFFKVLSNTCGIHLNTKRQCKESNPCSYMHRNVILSGLPMDKFVASVYTYYILLQRIFSIKKHSIQDF